MKKAEKKGWETAGTIVLMLIWVFASIVFSQILIGLLMIMVLGEERFQQPVWTTIYSALTYTFALALIIVIPRLAHKSSNKKDTGAMINRTELGLRGLPTWTDIGLAPAGFIVYLLIAATLSALFMFFPWFNAEEAQNIGFSTYLVGFDRIVAFITLVVIAPIAEEIIFRGWLYGKMRSKLLTAVSDRASMLISIFLVSLLFGIIHMQWNVGVNVFAMSIVLCGLREITGTIYAGILLHMLKNGVAFYLIYVLGISS